MTNGYEGFGRLASTSTDMGGVTRTLAYQYDRDGNRVRVTHPDGAYFASDYDGLGRPVRIRENTASSSDPTTYLATFYFNPDGTRESLLRGSTSPSAYVYTTYAYDALARPAGMNHALSGGAAYNVWAGFTYNRPRRSPPRPATMIPMPGRAIMPSTGATRPTGSTNIARRARPRSPTTPTAI